MINVNDLKNGMTILYEGNIYQVIEFQHVKPGKGSAFVRTKLKNLKANSTQEITFNAGIKLEKAHVSKEKLDYLYNTGNTYVFMNNKTFEQLEIDSSTLEGKEKFLKEGLTVEVLMYEGDIIGISLPEKVTYKVTYAEEAVKGNTTATALKDIKLENGLTIKAPIFIKEGEEVVVTTSDGKYSSRA